MQADGPKRKIGLLLALSPVLVLSMAKAGAVLFSRILPRSVSWIPVFLVYYAAIGITALILTQSGLGISRSFLFSFKPFPNWKQFLFLILLPALLPLSAFVTQIHRLSVPLILSLLPFALINGFFEEWYWRGMLVRLEWPLWAKALYSTALFSFSHFLLWSFWLSHPMILIPTLVSTLIMGFLWMIFTDRRQRLIYPVLSHILVDILNLSVAVYAGVVDFGHG